MGQYVKSSKSGYGIYIYADGRVYIGNFEKGKMHGLGTYKKSDTNIKNGIWKNGQNLKIYD